MAFYFESTKPSARSRSSFTLIELLIVIAVIAVLATVVILVINPAELLKESRDSNRLSDMKTLNQAIELWSEDTGGSPGANSTLYISVPDPTATTSLGDACQGLGLPTSSLPSGWTWHCAGPSFYKKVDGTGWIPIDFQSASFGSSLGSLPVDPTNSTSSGLYYTYAGSGDPYELTALMESSKYAMGGSHDVESTDGGQYPDLYEIGSNLTLDPLDYDPSLAGYWKLDEGSGTTAYDASGHGNDGHWYGTEAGTSGYYSAGHNQTYAGYFDGSTDYINTGSGTILNITGSLTISGWVNLTVANTQATIINKGSGVYSSAINSGYPAFLTNNDSWDKISAPVSGNNWFYYVATFDGTNARI